MSEAFLDETETETLIASNRLPIEVNIATHKSFLESSNDSPHMDVVRDDKDRLSVDAVEPVNVQDDEFGFLLGISYPIITEVVGNDDEVIGSAATYGILLHLVRQGDFISNRPPVRNENPAFYVLPKFFN